MANLWFRLYAEWLDDEKVQMLPEVMQARLIKLFCLRCQKQTETLHETQIAFRLRISLAELAEMKQLFLDNGFINKHWFLMNWEKRQFLSDSSTVRVRRHRSLKKQVETLHDENVTVIETPPDTDTEQKRSQKQMQKQKKINNNSSASDDAEGEVTVPNGHLFDDDFQIIEDNDGDPNSTDEDINDRDPNSTDEKVLAARDLLNKRMTPKKRELRKQQRAAVRRLFAYYLEHSERNPKLYTLTKSRMNTGLSRIEDCQRKCSGDLAKAEQLMGMAIDALLASEFHAGKNQQRKEYTDWTAHLFKSTEKLEWWLTQ